MKQPQVVDSYHHFIHVATLLLTHPHHGLHSILKHLVDMNSDKNVAIMFQSSP